MLPFCFLVEGQRVIERIKYKAQRIKSANKKGAEGAFFVCIVFRSFNLC